MCGNHAAAGCCSWRELCFARLLHKVSFINVLAKALSSIWTSGKSYHNLQLAGKSEWGFQNEEPGRLAHVAPEAERFPRI